MNKLYTILVLTALALSSASAQFTHTNSATVDAYEVTGNFDSYSWEWIGADSQSNTFYITFNGTPADLSSATLGWKMSLNTSTGKLDYLIVPDSDITYSATGTVTFAVANTNIPPDNTYLTELFAYTGATNVTRTLAQGIVDVRQSLYESDSEYTFPTSVDPADYVLKAGDFDQFTSLGGTAGQYWKADGSGSGSWDTPTTGDITSVVAGTGLDGGGTSGDVTLNLNAASIASLLLADSALQNGDSNTNLVNDAGYSTTVGDFLADGSVPMTGDFNGGDNAATNFSGVSIGAVAPSDEYPLRITGEYLGVLRGSIKNTSTGIFAQSALEAVNNLDYRVSLSVFGGSHGTLANVAGLYSTGYGNMAYVLDGNHKHVFYIDKDDGHSYGALTNEVMHIDEDGLDVSGAVIATDYEGDGSALTGVAILANAQSFLNTNSFSSAVGTGATVGHHDYAGRFAGADGGIVEVGQDNGYAIEVKSGSTLLKDTETDDLKVDGDLEVTGNITVDKIYFENGGTNSWLTMSSATSGVWRINGSNTVFNVTLGQE